jgi:uncharacterized membrane protein
MTSKKRQRQRLRRVIAQRGENKASVRWQANVQLNQASFYNGPVMPSVADLTEYNAVIPNGADRVFEWVRAQSENRMTMERAVVFANISKESRGQWMAFILGLVVITIGGFIVLQGRDARGYALIVSTLIWLAGTFITSKVQGRRELKRKRDELAKRGLIDQS